MAVRHFDTNAPELAFPYAPSVCAIRACKCPPGAFRASRRPPLAGRIYQLKRRPARPALLELDALSRYGAILSVPLHIHDKEVRAVGDPIAGQIPAVPVDRVGALETRGIEPPT